MRLLTVVVFALLAACQSVPQGPAADPLRGVFTLREATRGLKGDGELFAEITTGSGTLRCNLYDDRAPITVANFVGLARGIRPWRNAAGRWVKQPAYDGTSFHRVIPGFMIQGGDPSGTGEGEPGYVIPDEIWPGAVHDRRGQLAMANRGPNTNGMQFFITDGPARHLDGGYTLFGGCGPEELIQKLAAAGTALGKAATGIQKVSIRRAPRAPP
jgi:peptidyl-prolyl cis-trans isomerase A (cyclophilin A)